MDSGTTFKFRGYAGMRSGAAVSSLFLDYDEEEDDNIYDLDVNTNLVASGCSVRDEFERDPSMGNVAVPPVHYESPADICRVTDSEEVTCLSEGAIPDPEITEGKDISESSMCFDVPDAALSSCVWVGSSLLSRMLFQIYNEMGDESKTNTW